MKNNGLTVRLAGFGKKEEKWCEVFVTEQAEKWDKDERKLVPTEYKFQMTVLGRAIKETANWKVGETRSIDCEVKGETYVGKDGAKHLSTKIVVFEIAPAKKVEIPSEDNNSSDLPF